MAGIFDETNMRKALGECMPQGETLEAGIHGIGLETEIRWVFKSCALVGEQLVPKENGKTLEVRKSKYADHDLYIGITQRYLVLAECEEYKHLYEYNEVPALEAAWAEELTAPVSIKERGASFPLADIQSCELKKAWMGAVKCRIVMKNGSSLKLMFPKLGGLGGGMPHHKEYRERMIARLNALRA